MTSGEGMKKTGEKQHAKRPNILLITSDQQHWDTLGAFNPEVKTPNLDRLVLEGTTFSRAYCPNPTCTPTRASIITGQYPSQHGAWTLGTKLPEASPTLGDHLGAAGYQTALVGKAHFQPMASSDDYPSLEAYPLLQDLDFWKEFDERFYGFNHVELARSHNAEGTVGQHYALWLEAQGLSNWRDYFLPPTGTLDKATRHRWPIPEAFHTSTWIAERSNALLESYEEGDSPFFLWASFFDPHPRYLVPEPWDSMYDPAALTVPQAQEGEHEDSPPPLQMTQTENPDFSAYKESGFGVQGLHSHVHERADLGKDVAVYYGMISLLDKKIGDILDRLDTLGLADDTLVVFASDHGHFFGQHGLIAKGPFHYEDMIKVPLIVRWPGRVPAGKVSTSLQSLVDFSPTLLSLADLPVPRTMTGVNQAEVWRGREESARDHILCEDRVEPTMVHLKTYVDERYKLTVYYNQTHGELYDLETDPGELRNLWDDPDHAALKTDLLLRYIWAELGKEPMWMPRQWFA